MAPDPYKTLQLDPEADLEIIQVAYRKLAQRWHPDVAPGPEAARKMAELNAARDLLVDPARRAAYDRSRRAGAAAGAAAPSPGTGGAARTSRQGSASVASGAGAGSAGPPPDKASGTVLSFGRYAGWSLGEIARTDLEYVEWLDRMPIGRPHRAEIDMILRRSGRRGGATRAEEPHGLSRRR